MNKSTLESSKQAKREFYAQPHVANTYDELRFGGASGAWVDAREIEIVLSLLPPFRRALDLGCGTGRLTRALVQRGVTIGVDSSSAMLAQARQKSLSTLAQADAFKLAFADASFDAVTALRVAFHIQDLESLLSEIVRVLAPGGVAVFDTYLWSARSWRPLDPARWGGGVYIHSSQKLERIARESNLEVAGSVYCFLFSPYVYRRLPLWVVKTLARVERLVPGRFRSRVFWKLVRA